MGSLLEDIFKEHPGLKSKMNDRVYTDLWACPRPLTRHWGSGTLFDRIAEHYGKPDIVFGKQDQIPDGIPTVDIDPKVNPSYLLDWAKMDCFKDGQFKFGYWDPPYLAKIDDKEGVHYNRLEPCYREIARVCSWRLAILHPLLYPKPDHYHRIAVIAITYGPNKVIRCLQVFQRDNPNQQTIDI